jgi:hypothetical protein
MLQMDDLDRSMAFQQRASRLRRLLLQRQNIGATLVNEDGLDLRGMAEVTKFCFSNKPPTKTKHANINAAYNEIEQVEELMHTTKWPSLFDDKYWEANPENNLAAILDQLYNGHSTYLNKFTRDLIRMTFPDEDICYQFEGVIMRKFYSVTPKQPRSLTLFAVCSSKELLRIVNIPYAFSSMFEEKKSCCSHCDIKYPIGSGQTCLMMAVLNDDSPGLVKITQLLTSVHIDVMEVGKLLVITLA